jgi:phosphoadenosine phosphosulfate reductase
MRQAVTKGDQVPLREEELRRVAESFETRSPQELLSWSVGRYAPRIILACSFGAEDVVLVDMLQRLQPRIPLFYLDTDFLFPETYETRDRIVQRYGLLPDQVIQVKSRLTPAEQAAAHGDALWTRNPDLCCQLRKVEPLERVLDGYAAWITGIRRDQAPSRAQAGLVEWDHRFGLVKVNPLAVWRTEDVWRYIRDQEVPYNVLHDRHYPSIGCTHCTAPVMPGQDPRSGRWQGFDKTECGLHRDGHEQPARRQT